MQGVLESIPILHFSLIIIVKGNKRSPTIALHVVMCVFGICSWEDLEYTQSLQRHLLSLFSLFAAVHSRQHSRSQAVPLNSTSG